MIRFTHYYGHDVWISPDRVLVVVDGGCGSRGISAEVHLDTGKTVSVSGHAQDVARKIEEAKRK